ncbi:MAG: hypothetical protein JW850_08005 [Thermoflexales bacterium]|nr:hypothetical protein [Thermoflexales bacterium]
MLSRTPRRFSIEHLWALVTLAGIFVFTSTHPIRPHDFWWHARGGAEIVATGQIPSTDSFSFTAAGRPYIYRVYWLAEVALYLLYAAGGPAAVVFAHSLIVTAAYSLLLLVCRRLAHSWRTAAFCTLFAAALGFNDWNVRPQTISFLLGTLCLWAMYSQRATTGGRPYVLVFPLCMLIWVNSHGSFPIGLGLAGLWLLDSAWQALKTRQASGSAEPKRGVAQSRDTRPHTDMHLLAPSAAVGLSALACLANPQGPASLLYLSSMSSNPVVQNLVPEWASPTFDSLNGSLFLAGLLLSATALALSPRRPTLLQWASFLSFAALGLNTLRGSVWFGIVMAPILADHLPALAEQVRQIFHLSPSSKPDSTPPALQLALNTLLATLVLAGVVVCLPCFKHVLPLPPDKAGLISSETPVEATRFLLQNCPPRQVFHDQAFGSYLIWAAQPDYPVFVDPRIDLYPAQVWLDYIHIAGAGCDWEGLLERYRVNTLMLSLEGQAALVEAASQSPDWQVVYQDTQAIILVRATP